jgi:hypothetical protein
MVWCGRWIRQPQDHSVAVWVDRPMRLSERLKERLRLRERERSGVRR